MIARAVRYLLRVFQHVTVGAWLFWGAVAPLVILAGLALFWPFEPAFRWAGGALQLVGFSLSVWEIIGLQRLFDVGGVWDGIIRWWSQFPRGRRNTVVSMEGIASTNFVGSATLSQGRPPNASVSERLDRVEHDIDRLEGDLNIAKQENNAAHEKIAGDFKAADAIVSAQIEALGEKMTEATVGSLAHRALGVWFFIAGIILATISPELCDWHWSCVR